MEWWAYQFFHLINKFAISKIMIEANIDNNMKELNVDGIISDYPDRI